MCSRRQPRLAGVARGGTARSRSRAAQPARHPFDPFAHYADLKPFEVGVLRRNLPSMWRCFCGDCWPVRCPSPMPVRARPARYRRRRIPHGAAQAARFDMEPTGNPVVLFNISQHCAQPRAAHGLHHRSGAGADSHGAPHPGHAAGVPEEYVAVNTYDAGAGASGAGD